MSPNLPAQTEHVISRRSAIKVVGGVCASVMTAPMLNLGHFRLFARSARGYSARAIALVQRSVVIDMLSPLTLDFPRMSKLIADPESFPAADSYGFREKIDIEGLDHPKRMFDLTEGLIRRKYDDAQIEGILGGNFRRVLSSIWMV